MQGCWSDLSHMMLRSGHDCVEYKGLATLSVPVWRDEEKMLVDTFDGGGKGVTWSCEGAVDGIGVRSVVVFLARTAP
jgi:hypothetical protein